MNLAPRLLIIAALAAPMLSGCGQPDTSSTAPAPQEITSGTACALDGMLLADYPGPKAQIHYAGRAEPDFFCDTVEMFNIYLKPEQVRAVSGLYVQDMGKADWDNPRGNWIDARKAYYVLGSTKRGSMGPTIASFADKASAEKFAGQHGGKVHVFGDITADMVVLDGGALHDSNM